MIAFDVGLGTQDILISDYLNEDSIKFVLPSPSQIIKNKVEEIDNDLFFSGYTMGGGPLSKVICAKAKSHDVIMVKEAARTISDDLEEVKEEGIEVIDEEEVHQFDLGGFTEVELSDLVTLPQIKELLNEIGVDFPEVVGVGVQDHGVSPEGVSDRKFRFEFFKEAIQGDGGFEDLVFWEKTDRFSRMNSVFDYLFDRGFEAVVMDSKLASVLGCLGNNNRVIIDAGNGHFLGASCKGSDLVGLFEHHTKLLDKSKIKELVNKLIDGFLRNEEVFEDGGHGAFVKEGIDPDEVVVTGPNRDLMPNEIDHRFANPNGDVMMTGAVGLFRAKKNYL